QRGLPPAAVGVLGERRALVVGERPSERSPDLLEIPAAQELPGEMAGERRHRHAMPSRDDRRSFFERGEVAGPAVAVGDQDVAEPGARQRAAGVEVAVWLYAPPTV